MRKDDERQHLHKVFGEAAIAARDQERPDFLLATGYGENLGVEVTSLFASNSEAKLDQVEGYTDALLDRTTDVHRADRDDIEVGDLTLVNEHGVAVDTVVGIIRHHPSPRQQLQLLFARIAEKEAKFPHYRRSCRSVDLIVKDESRLFRHKDHEDFYTRYQLLFPRRRLLSSPFREIYLLTSTTDLEEIFVPLIGNALASDCFGYLSLLEQPEYQSPERAVHDVLSAALLNDGHSRVEVSSTDAGRGYCSGAWEVFIDEETFAIRNWMVPHAPYSGRRITDMVANVPAPVLSYARSLTTVKRRSLAMLDMRLPAHE